MQGGIDFPPLRMVVLVGIPGSGKSTFAEQMAGLGWAVVNQDKLGNRKKCENAAVDALQAGREVVIDRCNFDKGQRAVWINIARQYNAVTIGVHLLVDVQECIRRCQARTNHATVSPEKAPAVVTRLAHDFQQVTQDEGLVEFYRVQTDVEFQNMVAYLGPARQQAYPAPPVMMPPAPWWSPGGHGVANPSPNMQHQLYFSQSPALGYREGGPPWEGSTAVPASQPAEPRRFPEGHPESPGYRSMRKERSRQHSKGPGPQSWRDPRSPVTGVSSNAVQGQQAGPYVVQGAHSTPVWVPMASSAGPAAGVPLPGRGSAAGAPTWAPHTSAQGTSWGQEAGFSTRAWDPNLAGPPQSFVIRQRPAVMRETGRAAPGPPGTHPPEGLGLASSHIVPFRREKAAGRTVPDPAGPSGAAGPAGGPEVPYLDDGLPDDGRIILLFDLNGTLTSHTAQRRSAGISRMRPGTHHLYRLKEKFRLGIYSSATRKTVKSVLPMLEEAAGSRQHEALFDTPSLILCRQHTVKAPQQHIAGGGKPWDTCKPLGQWFRSIHRVLLVDDDGYKAMPDETGNMVQMPCWHDEDSRDDAIQALVNSLLATFADISPDADVRQYSGKVTKALAAAVVAATVPSERRCNFANDDAGEACEQAQVVVVEDGAELEDVRYAKSSKTSYSHAAGMTVDATFVQGIQFDRAHAVQLVPQDSK